MKVLGIFLIICLASANSAPVCDSFKCAAEGVTVPEGKCVKKIKVEGSEFVLGHIKLQCKENQFCNTDWRAPGEGETSCVDTPARTNLVDGQDCDEKNTCYNGVTCTDKKCVGKKATVDCDVTNECATGLYCSAGKCTAQIADDKTECASDYDCANTHGCNSDKKCTLYSSLEVGAATNKASLCKSAEISEEKCSTSTLQGQDWKCTDKQTTCKYTIKTTEEKKDVEKGCMCNFSSASVKYCPGDNSKISDKTFKPKTGVHSVRRTEGTSNLAVWPYLEEADDCIKKLNGYVAPSPSGSGSSSSSSFIKFTIGSVAILAFLLF